MTDTAKHLRETREKLEKLRKYKGKGVSRFDSFTIDISYGGNKEPDVRRVGIGSCTHPEGTGAQLIELAILCLEGSLKFWTGEAERDTMELLREVSAAKDAK